MRIKRGDLVVQLTDDELYAAYKEQQRRFDKENVDEEIEDSTREALQKAGIYEAFLEEAAGLYRKYRNKGMSSEYALSEAVNDVKSITKINTFPEEEARIL